MIDDEVAILRRIDQEWAAAAAQGADLDRIVSFWSEDAKIYPPGAPVVEGRRAIREFVAGSRKILKHSVTWEPTEVVVGPAGDIGYITGRNCFTYLFHLEEIVTRSWFMAARRSPQDGSRTVTWVRSGLIREEH